MPDIVTNELYAEIDRLRARVKELEDWKASAAEVERSWDAQKVGEEAELTSLKSNLPKSALDLEKENERLKAELTEAHSFLARQQYADLQLLGKRDEKIRHLENELAEARELFVQWWTTDMDNSMYFNKAVQTDEVLSEMIKDALKAGEVENEAIT